MLKIYFDQCQILKISSIYKEISQFTVHPLEMHTVYLKYHFVRASKGIRPPLNKLINTQTLPVQLVDKYSASWCNSEQTAREHRVSSNTSRSPSYNNIFIFNCIYLLVSFRQRKSWKESYFHILFGKVTPLKTGKKDIAFRNKTNWVACTAKTVPCFWMVWQVSSFPNTDFAHIKQ